MCQEVNRRSLPPLFNEPFGYRDDLSNDSRNSADPRIPALETITATVCPNSLVSQPDAAFIDGVERYIGCSDRYIYSIVDFPDNTAAGKPLQDL